MRARLYILICFLLSALPLSGLAAAQDNCGVYLSVGVTNINAGFNEVILWTWPGSAPSALTLRREFWHNGAPGAKPAEVYANVESVGSINVAANAEGYAEHFTLADGNAPPIATCVVTVNSPQSSQPQVITFFVSGRTGIAPGVAQVIVWETRNVGEVQLLGFDPNRRLVLSANHLPASGNTSIVIPANYSYRTLRLVLQLDLVPMNVLPPAAFLDLPINLAGSPAVTQAPAPTAAPADWHVVSGATSQPFEHGLMLWLPGGPQPALILYDDGTWQYGAWRDLPNTFRGISPGDRFVPWYGYALGKIWAQNDDVRVRLGWALSGEHDARIETRGSGDDWQIRLPDGKTRRLRNVAGSRTWTLVG